MDKERKKCKYPMSKFYIYEDEVPKGTRVSTEKDCKECDFRICEADNSKFCLIWE